MRSDLDRYRSVAVILLRLTIRRRLANHRNRKRARFGDSDSLTNIDQNEYIHEVIIIGVIPLQIFSKRPMKLLGDFNPTRALPTPGICA